MRPASRFVGCLLAAAVVAPVASHAQRDTRREPTGSAVLAGHVIAADGSGRPVRRATVYASGASLLGTRQVLTDDEGRFALTGLPAGTYRIGASKPGWVPAYLGAREPWRGPGVPQAVGEGERRTDLEIAIAPGAAISGRVLDQRGQPQAGARVIVLAPRRIAGRVNYSPQLSQNTIQETDDQGTFRIYGLPPGDFIVGASVRTLNRSSMRLTTPAEVQWAQQLLSREGADSAPAAPPQGGAVAYAPVYYPGVTDPAAATAVTVGLGEDRTNVDFQIEFVETATVSGTLRLPGGEPAAQALLELVPKNRNISVSSLLTGNPFSTRASLDANGTFTFESVPPGDYSVMAQAASSPPELDRQAPRVSTVTMDLWANQDVVVAGQDVSGLMMTMQPGMTVSGTVSFEATTLVPPPPATTVVRLMPAGPSQAARPAAARVADDGSFSAEGVLPGRYLISTSVRRLPGQNTDWIPLDAMLNGTNIAFEAFEVRPGGSIEGIVVRFSDQPATVSGTITDGAGRPVADLTIIMFTADPARWSPETIGMHRAVAQPDQNGRFVVERIRPGSYYLAALSEIGQADLTDPAFFEDLAAGAIPITLALGEHKTQDIQLASGGGG